MIEYIYFVKCADCADEFFDFFEEAKEYALSQINKKPCITQTEVCRNDFGECTDSRDLGTVWSWEEVMSDVPEDPETGVDNVFTRCDFDKYADGYDPDNDPEFDDSDITFETDCVNQRLNEIPDNFKKPVPADMTIESLVEAMEENEDMVECKRCHELYPKVDCLYELSRGYLCPICIMDLDAADEQLEFKPRELPKKVVDEEDILEESVSDNFYEILDDDTVVLYYNDLDATVCYNQTDADDWSEKEYHSKDFEYKIKLSELSGYLWDWLVDDDYEKFNNAYEVLYKDEDAWNAFVKENLEELLKKYKNKIFNLYEDRAEDAFVKHAYDKFENQDNYEEDLAVTENKTSFLEELEDSEVYNKRLTMCPECGGNSFDIETGICINCGFSTLTEEMTNQDYQMVKTEVKNATMDITDEIVKYTKLLIGNQQHIANAIEQSADKLSNKIETEIAKTVK